MLGKVINDPYEIESTDGQLTGLGYLDMETVIERDKNLTRKSGVHQLSGKNIFGYEIHHGISSMTQFPVLHFDDGTICGQMKQSEKIWGCYLHGIFDSDDFRRWFIDSLRERSGLKPVGEIIAPYNLEIAFDRLAACVRENVDMDTLYRLLKI
jgi:cobyric acid synthase